MEKKGKQNRRKCLYAKLLVRGHYPYNLQRVLQIPCSQNTALTLAEQEGQRQVGGTPHVPLDGLLGSCSCFLWALLPPGPAGGGGGGKRVSRLFSHNAICGFVIAATTFIIVIAIGVIVNVIKVIIPTSLGGDAIVAAATSF